MSQNLSDYKKVTVVHIHSGRVFDVLSIVPQPTKWEPNPRAVGWRESELRQNGLPDRRTSPTPIGMRRRDYGDGEISVSGNHAIHRPEHEAHASGLRANIQLAKAALEAAENALENFYDELDNGPRK